MAQNVAIEYLGSIRVEKNIPYTSTSITTAFTGATIIQAKIDHIENTKNFVHEFVNVSINDTPFFHFEDGDVCVIGASKTFVFEEEFTMAVGKYVVI